MSNAILDVDDTPPEISETEDTNQSLSFNDHALTGAMIASFIAGFSILLYLLNTSWNFDSLFSFVFGINYEIGEGAIEPLFVLVARFFLVYSITWLPATAIVAVIENRS